MATIKMKSNYAVTININPMTYIKVPKDGKMISRRWTNHDDECQKYYLTNFIGLLSRYKVDHKSIEYKFEKTQKDNNHMHVHIEDAEYKQVYHAKRDFCLLIDKKMTDEFQDRCVMIKHEFNPDGWVDYINKEQVPEELVETPHSPENMEGEIINKLRKKLF